MTKKLLVLLFAILLSLNCFAEGETYANAGELYAAWAENYPDYICGIWSTDGSMNNLTFSVLNSEEGEKGKEEILALVEDDSTVTFEYGVVSRNYLLKVQDELFEYFDKDLGLAYSAIYEMQNRIGLGILIDRAEDPDTLAMLEEIKAKYGGIFIIEYTGGISTALPLVEPNSVQYTQTHNEGKWQIVCYAVAFVAVAAVAFVLIRKLKRK